MTGVVGVRRLVAVALPLLVALLMARLVVGSPLLTLGAVFGLAVAAALLLNPEWAALTFVAIEPFEDYVRALSGSAVKGIGAVLILSWAIRGVVPRDDGTRRRRTGAGLRHPVALAGATMIAAVLASTVLHSNGSVGVEVLTRYLSFLGALVVLVDLMSKGLAVRRVAAVFATSCALAAAAGIGNYLGGAARVGGPLGDPNDFAFFMVVGLPLALVLRRSARRAWLWDLAAVLMIAAMVGTLSRGALFAVVAMIVYALLNGVIRLRVIGAVFGLLLVLLGVLAVTEPSLISNSLEQKQYVASQNVDERLIRWQVTAEMTVDYPLLGIGPGGFRLNYDHYVDPSKYDLEHQLDVAHETYLETSAELGLIGLVAFLAILCNGFTGAYRRSRLRDEDAWISGGVCAAIVGAMVAAVFLTEQYYLPLWMLAAMGAALDPVGRAGMDAAAAGRAGVPDNVHKRLSTISTTSGTTATTTRTPFNRKAPR